MNDGDGDVEAPWASVAVPVPVRRLFTYAVPAAFGKQIEIGARVRVPFGNRKVRGTVVEWPAAPPDRSLELREIEALLPDATRLTPEILELTRFMSEYYLCSWGDAIECALPPDPGRPRLTRWVRRATSASAESLPERAVARRRAFAALPADGSAIRVDGLPAAARRSLAALAELGMVEIDERATESRGSAAEPWSPPYRLTEPQRSVLDRLDAALATRTYAPFLLFGETGSGKTEVYLGAASAAIEAGMGVLYLVPEIGLTPLLVGQIERRFPSNVAVLHSALSRRERFDAWDRVRRGACRLAVGTRSAVFAPLPDLGLIIVDEEQDSSYKQEEAPRYNARDLAVVRARSAGATIVLGSATPSLESFQHTRSGRYTLLELGGRVERRPLPEVSVVDMREEYRDRGAIPALSRRLVSDLAACVEKGEQALILRNRRGWAAAVLCPTCGERISCTRCSVAMTWHRSERRLRCHYCDLVHLYPETCPTCGAEELKLLGEGTERIEDDLRAALPGARIERLDRDVTRRKGAQERLLRRFDAGEIDVLVGTQMIAKGHDFPRVTLVGVLSADQALGLPDFRAAERTFQLLTQVAGRAGRGERPGIVVVQAFDPGHPVVRLAAAQDYEAFFEREIRYRRALRYPPLAAMVELLIVDRQELRAREWAEELAGHVRREGGGRLLIAGPGPAPLERLRGKSRQQILVRTVGRRRLVEAVGRALGAVEGKIPSRAIHVDVDPLSVL